MLPVYSKVLPKLGFNRHLPRAYRYALFPHQNQDLPHVLVMQDTSQITTFLSHMGKHTYVGDSIESCLESASIAIDAGGNIFSLDFSLYGDLLTESWVKVLWKFYWENNITLLGEYSWPVLTRENDRYLMRMLLKDSPGLFTCGEIRLLNSCRLFLRVISLAYTAPIPKSQANVG